MVRKNLEKVLGSDVRFVWVRLCILTESMHTHKEIKEYKCFNLAGICTVYISTYSKFLAYSFDNLLNILNIQIILNTLVLEHNDI